MRSRSVLTAIKNASKEQQYFVVTLNRSPLHVHHKVKATCDAIQLNKRLATAILPVSQQSVGFINRIKELVSVKLLKQEQLERIAKSYEEQDERTGDARGNKGSGLQLRSHSIIKVGSNRARGEQRGYKAL